MVEKKLKPVCQACGETVDPEVTCSECGAVLTPLPDFVTADRSTREKILETLEMDIKKDREAAELTYATGVSAYTKHPVNLFMRGPSSTGKSYITTRAIQYFPEDDVSMLGDLSPKALVHQKGKLVDEDLNPLPPKPKKDYFDDTEKYKKAKKEWKRKAKDAKNLIDLHHQILVFLEAPNRKTFDMLRPILSHDTWIHEYKIAESSSKGLHTNEILLRGWPATVFCTTEPDFLEDLVTRSLTITPRMDGSKFKAANKHTAKQFANPLEDSEKVEKKEELRDYTEKLVKVAKNIKIAVPYAEALSESYPHNHRQDMRDFKKFLSIIQVQALMHAFERPLLQVDGEWLLNSTSEDLENALKPFEKAFLTTQTGLSQDVIEVYRDVFLPLKGKEPGYGEIIEKYHEERKDTISREWLRTKVVKPLEHIGWIDVQPDPSDKRKKRFQIQGQIKTFENLWEEIRNSIGEETVKKCLKNTLKIPLENGNLSNSSITTAWYSSIDNYDAVDIEDFIDKIVNHKANFETENKAPSGDQSVEDAGKNAQRHSKFSEDLDDMEPSQKEKHRKMLEIVNGLKRTSIDVKDLRKRAEEEGLVDEKETGDFFPTFLEKAEKEWGIVSIDDGIVKVL